ncbi:MAG: hypothetical protein A2017_22375 [Lentisphaerae bacterium GWF2_44_16]|nr:MAG: hypothetical protein A2017_22375 [Lentisphaerae bacterium GWF2_44_16]
MKDKINRTKKADTADNARSVSEKTNEMGLVKIHENVIASIVRKVTCSIKGVLRLAGSPLLDNIAEIVGSRKIHDRAISINLADDDVKIEVKINVAYGVHVPTLAVEIQTAIIEEVEKITGMRVSQVNIIVQELDEEDSEKDEEKEEEIKN